MKTSAKHETQEHTSFHVNFPFSAYHYIIMVKGLLDRALIQDFAGGGENVTGGGYIWGHDTPPLPRKKLKRMSYYKLQVRLQL